MKNKKKIKPIKHSILVFGGLFLSLVLVVCIMGIYFDVSYQRAQEDVQKICQDSAEKKAENIELFFLRHEDVLLTASKALEYALDHESDLADIEILLRSISESYNDEIYEKATKRRFTGIYAAVDGTLVHGMHSSDELDPWYNPLERQWYKEGMRGAGAVVFGEPYVDIYDKSAKVMTATKLLKDNKTVLGMDIPMEDLQTVIGNMEISIVVNGDVHTYGSGFLLTENGIVMAHSTNIEEQGKDYSQEDSPLYPIYLHSRDCERGKTILFEEEMNGIRYGILSRHLTNGWYAITLVDLQNIHTSIATLTGNILLVAGIMIAIGILYCTLITRAFFRSEKLSEELKRMLALVKQDGLTGFLNRTAYDMKVVELQGMLTKNKDTSFALVMLDLNDLKYVNDHFGHNEGDRYIQNSCTLMKQIFPCDIYRIGGDEFAIFLTDELFEQWELLYEKFKQAVANANLNLTPNADEPSIAIGVAVHDKDTKENIFDMLFRADAEMYTNKLAIKQIRVEQSEKGHAPDIQKLLSDKQELAKELRNGLLQEQFEIWYQPQVNHTSKGALIGVEALVRWRHPKKGLVPPSVFIPIMEYNGLIYELDKYVWRHACKTIRSWIDEGKELMPVSVNISRLDLLQPDFVSTILETVKEYEIPHELLHLEITESAFTDEEGKIKKIVDELIQNNFIIAIDDFGSGYSSLSLLRSVKAHIVKLDLRFFADEEDKTRNECIIESVIRMVKMLGMAVVAEGVERFEQAELLKSLGCPYIQGYLYSEPLPPKKLEDYVNTVSNENLFAHTEHSEEAGEEYIQSREMLHDLISGTNDVIIVADNETKQLLYANRSAELYFGKRFDPMKPTTCTEYCERGELCTHCPADKLAKDERREFFMTQKGAHLKLLYMQMNWNGHNAHVYYQTDVTIQKQLEMLTEAKGPFGNLQEIMELGLQEAMRQTSVEQTIEYIVGFVGRILNGERAYIFEKNEDRTDSNTFEWVSEGITPEKENLQNIPEEVSLPWYEQFKSHQLVIIEDLEEIKETYPLLYEALVVQNISSLVVAPFFNNYGEPMGFFGIDNPPKGMLSRNAKLVQSVAYFIEASIKRRNLENS